MGRVRAFYMGRVRAFYMGRLQAILLNRPSPSQQRYRHFTKTHSVICQPFHRIMCKNLLRQATLIKFKTKRIEWITNEEGPISGFIFIGDNTSVDQWGWIEKLLQSFAFPGQCSLFDKCQASDSLTWRASMDLVSLFLLLIAIAGQSADGLSTDKCSHAQLLKAFHGFEICMVGMGHIPFLYISPC